MQIDSGEHNKAASFKDHFFAVNDLDFTIQNPWMASCSNDTIVNVYDLEKGQLCRSFVGGHTSFVNKCKFTAQENILLSAGADNFLFLWDVRQNKMIQRILAHPEPITGLDVSFDSTLIATSAYDGYVRLWDMHKATCIKTMMPDCGSINNISNCKFTPNGQFLFIGTMNGELGMYDLHNNLMKAYLGHKNQEAILDLCLINRKETGSFLMGGSEDGRVVGWDLNSQKVLLNRQICPEDTTPKNENEIATLPPSSLVSSVDHHDGSDLVATCGTFPGVHLFNLTNEINSPNL